MVRSGFLVLCVVVVGVFAGIEEDLSKLEHDLALLNSNENAFLQTGSEGCRALGGLCKVVSQCTGSTRENLCFGAPTIKCCVPGDNTDDSNNNNNDNSNDNNDEASSTNSEEETSDDEASSTGGAPTYSAPFLPTSGSPGSPGGPCTQAQRGRCGPESQCNLSAGYRIQRGRCGGSDVCCTPRNAGGDNDIIPDKFFQRGALCYPITRDSFDRARGDYGNRRNNGRRCHSGEDILTKRPSTAGDNVVAIDDGIVTFRPSSCFTNCNFGWGMRAHGGKETSTCAGNLLVYHESIDRTVNYGEIDFANIRHRKDARVRRGEKLGVASVCGMLHFEIYRGRQNQNFRWYPTQQCKDTEGHCSIPRFSGEANMCAKHAMHLKNPVTLDPRPYLHLLHPSTGSGTWC